MLDPRAIQHKKFKETRLAAGYDQDEVDAFLDECVETIQELQRQLDDARLRLDQSQAQLVHAQAGVGLAGIEKLLTVAQQQADQTVADANHQANSLVAEATTKANGILGGAYNKADQVAIQAGKDAEAKLATAQAAGEEMIVRATAQRDQLLNHTNQLAGVRDDLLSKLTSALELVRPNEIAVTPESVSTVVDPNAETTVLPAVVENEGPAA